MAAPKALPKVRCWCFTSYEVKLHRFSAEKQFDPEKVRYCVWQYERGEDQKTLHIQGYIEFFSSVRLAQVKATVGEAHCEMKRGTRVEARDYCMKKKTRVKGPFVFGVWREEQNRKRKLKDLLKSGMSINDLIDEEPQLLVRYPRGMMLMKSRRAYAKAKKRKYRKVQVVLLWGPTGTGKTWSALHDYGDDVYTLPNKNGNSIWFDMYDGEGVLLIDDFDGWVPYPFLLRLLDIYNMLLPSKGSHIVANWHTVVITSNSRPRDWYSERCLLSNIDPLMRRVGVPIHMARSVVDAAPMMMDLDEVRRSALSRHDAMGNHFPPVAVSIDLTQ